MMTTSNDGILQNLLLQNDNILSELNGFNFDVGEDPMLSGALIADVTGFDIPGDEPSQDFRDTWDLTRPEIVSLEIKKIPRLLEWSPNNRRYHVKSGSDGNMTLTCQYSNVTATDGEDKHYLSMELRRTSPKYSDVPVDAVCAKHRKGLKKIAPILAAADSEKFSYYDTNNSVILYQVEPSTRNQHNQVEIVGTPSIKFPCNDSCVNSTLTERLRSQQTCPEAARDLVLVVQLVIWSGRVQEKPRVLHEQTVPVWIKAAINTAHLQLEERRRPKGAAAQKIASKRKLEEAQAKSELEADEDMVRRVRQRFHHLTEEQKAEIRSVVLPSGE